jgi:hypothetical protein
LCGRQLLLEFFRELAETDDSLARLLVIRLLAATRALSRRARSGSIRGEATHVPAYVARVAALAEICAFIRSISFL